MSATYDQLNNLSGVYKAMRSEGSVEEKIIDAVNWLRQENDVKCRSAAKLLDGLPALIEDCVECKCDKLGVIKIGPNNYEVPEEVKNDSVIQLAWLVGTAKIINFVLTTAGLATKITSPTLLLGGKGDFTLIISL